MPRSGSRSLSSPAARCMVAALFLMSSAAWPQPLPPPTSAAATAPGVAGSGAMDAGPAPGVLTPADAPSSFGHYQPARIYTQQAVSSFYVPMRDGTRI
ncbi:MAG: hypothetical protein ACKOUM_04110, partial [Sphingopyxis sp.]